MIKNETLKPLEKNLRIAQAGSLTGPFTELSPAFTDHYCEGPTALRVDGDWVVYFDCYTKSHYGAMRWRDLKHWEDVTSKIVFPAGARHGTIIRLPQNVIAPLMPGRGAAGNGM